MTNDLISRSALLLEMAAGCMPLCEKGISGVTGDESTIYDYIKDAPAVDAAPVVHGRWEHIADYGCGNCYGYCSECRIVQRAENATALKMANKYCPYCGARMDKEAVNAQE